MISDFATSRSDEMANHLKGLSGAQVISKSDPEILRVIRCEGDFSGLLASIDFWSFQRHFDSNVSRTSGSINIYNAPRLSV